MYKSRLQSLRTLTALLVVVVCTARVEATPKPVIAAGAGVVYVGKVGGGGGGIVVGCDLVVTCRHVIAPAKTVSVVFSDGVEFAATVVRHDGADLVLLRVAKMVRADLHVLVLAKKAPAQGDDVWAWGHPRGFMWSLSRGIVSATDRKISLPNAVTLGGCIQTDAAIAPGSSGGPLLNSAGEVVGLVTAMSDEGIGFAIPASAVRALVDGPLK